MRAKTVNEFTRGGDPKETMGLGFSPRVKEMLRKVDLEKYFSKNNVNLHDPNGSIILMDIEIDDDYANEMSNKYNISFENEDGWGDWTVSGKYFDILRFMVNEQFITSKEIWNDEWDDEDDFMFYATEEDHYPIEDFLKIQEALKYADKVVDYEEVAKDYLPDNTEYLLIGEAPPHENPENYFYVPRKKGVGTGYQGFHKSLPGLVFQKFLGYKPTNEKEYIQALLELRELGVRLIDLVKDPLVVSERIKREGMRDEVIVHPEAVDVLVNAVPDLKDRVEELGVLEENIILLNLRSRVNTALKKSFPNARFYKSWNKFLEDPSFP